MNRRRFFGRLASAVGVAAVAPAAMKAAAETVLIPGVPGTRIVIPYRQLVGRVTFSGPELARARTIDGCLRDIYAPHIAKMVNEPSPFFDAFLNERGGDDA